MPSSILLPAARSAGRVLPLAGLLLLVACGGSTAVEPTPALSVPTVRPTSAPQEPPSTPGVVNPPATPGSLPPGTPGSLPATAGQAELVAALQAAGLTLAPGGPVQQPFLAVPGAAFNRGDVQVFEYADAAAAGADAAKIQADGSIPGVMVDWMAQPHFYRTGRLVVIYLGADPAALKALDSLLGPAFATGAPRGPGGPGGIPPTP
ncbi:MAG TPA: hypothetical protein VM536_08155 [Chloroflexia bacterium]|nr:hypothetical protein [Chloroflexia bacterium]